MVGGVKETWVVLGRTPVQKGLMAPSPAWAQGGGPHGMSGQMDLRKTMNVPFCERNRMTLRPKGSTEVIKKPHKDCFSEWRHRSSKNASMYWKNLTWANRSFVTNLRYDTAVVLSCLSHVRLFSTLWTVACQAPLSMGFSRQEYWSELHVLLQGIFLIHGLNPSLLGLLYWQVGSLPPAPPGKP